MSGIKKNFITRVYVVIKTNITVHSGPTSSHHDDRLKKLQVQINTAAPQPLFI